MAETIEAKTQTQARQNRLNELLNTSQKKTYFVAAVTVLFVVVMLMVGVLPSYSAFTAQAVQNTKRQEAIDALEIKRTTIENLVKEEGSKADLLTEFNLAFPTTTFNQINVLKVANDLAVRNNVVLLNTTISDIVNTNEIIKKFLVTPQVKAQTVSASLEGDKDNLNAYIDNIENNVNLFDVTSALIARKDGKELESSIAGREFKLSIQFNYFYYVQTP